MNKRFLVGILGVVMVFVTACIGREKVERYSGVTYTDNCVFDNANAISNPKELENSLEKFYKLSGIQPYVLTTGYMSSIHTQEQADEYAEQFYADNITEGRSILFVYYSNYEESELGYHSLVMGTSLDKELKDKFKSVVEEESKKYLLNPKFSMGEAISEIFLESGEELFN